MQIGNGQFLLGDCLELMRDIPDGSVNMVVTSPPYDNLRTYNGMPAFTFDVFRPIADQLARVLKPGGVIVWNVADATVNGSETGSSFRQALYFKDECGLNLHDTMIWNKPNPMPGGSKYEYQSAWEYMFVFSKGRPSCYNLLTEPTKTAGAINTRVGSSGADGWVSTKGERVVRETKKRQNVWSIPKSADGKGHPAVFPLQLPTDHILSWSNPNDLVLDPFAGSGTTAIAAENTGRRWTCIERDPTYYEQAIARVWEHLVDA